jgi:thiol-disulfide isomerase/thioredoxin
MDAAYLQSKHQAGLTYDQYVNSGNENQRDNWKRIYDQAHLTDSQQTLVKGFVRRMKVIFLSGIWCGDCVQQGPLVQRIVDANPDMIDMRYLDRDEHADLQKIVRINQGNRVPMVLFCAEDHELAAIFGDRTLSRYRAIAARQLGPSCPAPGAPVDADEMAATVADWVDQFERVHLMLRISPRLRAQYGD